MSFYRFEPGGCYRFPMCACTAKTGQQCYADLADRIMPMITEKDVYGQEPVPFPLPLSAYKPDVITQEEVDRLKRALDARYVDPVFPLPYSACKPEPVMKTIIVDLFQNKVIISVPGGYWRVYPKPGFEFSIDFTDIIKIQTP